ncbi:hypothetical protein GOP47_0008801 [Adiantum capillus-veneris]|uniref:Uncharacterized protein n=1 Tax=Adiantum capillus-veneris TaxID=13818 RepID=A0A9D4ZKR0_ADICA|nr:hypothetical protein GOP47_0008801 [Adiantum capillus-veneris]
MDGDFVLMHELFDEMPMDANHVKDIFIENDLMESCDELEIFYFHASKVDMDPMVMHKTMMSKNDVSTYGLFNDMPLVVDHVEGCDAQGSRESHVEVSKNDMDDFSVDFHPIFMHDVMIFDDCISVSDLFGELLIVASSNVKQERILEEVMEIREEGFGFVNLNEMNADTLCVSVFDLANKNAS